MVGIGFRVGLSYIDYCGVLLVWGWCFWVAGLVFGFGWVWWFCGFAWFLVSWVCYNIVFLGLGFVSGIFGLFRVIVGGCGGFS